MPFSTLLKRRSCPSMLNHRLILVLAALTMATPVILQVAQGASVHSDATLHPLDLLTLPYNVGLSKGLTQRDDASDSIGAASNANKMDGSAYPTKDLIPDVNHPQVKAWVAEIDWSKVPKIPVAKGMKDSPHFPDCPPKEEVDKASEATPAFLEHLKSKKISATFFIVGSRVLEYPEILKAEVAEGHHIAMHTWSHAGLTTLTNEQIVAEVRWTEKIIRDVTGLTMKYIRPPYGDCDNRVREILRQMGYSTVIWTLGWDTRDWQLPLHQIQKADVLKYFNEALNNMHLVTSKVGGLGGPITLEHDLTVDTIDIAKTVIPIGVAKGLKPMNLAQCLNDPHPYQTTGSGENNKGAGTPKDGKDGVLLPANGASDSDRTGEGSGASSDANGGSKKSDATATVLMMNCGQVAAYATMGLSLVATYMLTL
ncbi:chitin deacetylase [Mortierella alpina]|uniref:Chitin deacetylase n=1 Tax=Mortierella alpina TaxID=64518 RepID=A0A9P6J3R2_MORAP|nr:chitin deacetylase [Mortierella alpina]